jgi:5'(3')-deoxyribonucleotidase
MPNPASKTVIAIDVDEVLASNAPEFVDFSNKRWGTNLNIDDYHEHWGELWRIQDDQEIERRAVAYHHSGSIGRLKPINKAKEVLQELSKSYSLYVLTSRRLIVEKETKDWLDSNFPDVFDRVEFAGIWDKVVKDRMKMTKTDRLKALGVEYFIDDQPRHCFAAAEAGIKTLLFGDYKWNHDLKLPEGVTWVKNWQEVLEYFTRQNFPS